PLVADRPAALERARHAERERERLLGEELEADVGLSARVRDPPAAFRVRHVRDDTAAEQREPRPWCIERRRAESTEAQRWKIRLEHGAREVGACDLIERHAGEATPFAVVLRVLV